MISTFRNEYAPLVLFVYKRPEHLKKVLSALLDCEEASKTDLVIFADGPKNCCTRVDCQSIQEVRSLIDNVNGFKSKQIFKSAFNLGLANSVVNGVNYVLKSYEKVIVLEDDLLPGRYFLQYMNEALTMYENNTKIGCVHAWNYPLCNFWFEKDTYFLRGADCWGWATWKKKWGMYNGDSKYLLDKIRAQKLSSSFNDYGVHQYTKMLEDNANNEINSWAINWRASLFLNNQFCLYPKKALVFNLGLDGSGTHSGIHNWQSNNVHWLPIIDETMTFSSNIYFLKVFLFKITLFFKRYLSYFGFK